jgi:hypothetical protein
MSESTAAKVLLGDAIFAVIFCLAFVGFALWVVLKWKP